MQSYVTQSLSIFKRRRRRVSFTRAEWNAIKDMQSGTVTRTITDTTLPTGPVERTID